MCGWVHNQVNLKSLCNPNVKQPNPRGNWLVRLSLPVIVSTDVKNRNGEGRGKGTDGGSERVEEIGETDHLRSVGRQHKPVGEGRSPLDSVLHRDRKRDRESGVTKGRMKAKETERGCRMVKTDTKTEEDY